MDSSWPRRTLLDDNQRSRALDDECAAAAYFIAKMGTGKRDRGVENNQLSVLALKTLVEHRTELMALRQENGTLTINDMWKTLVGKNASANGGAAANFSDAIGRKLFAEIQPSRTEGMFADYDAFACQLPLIMLPVTDYGVSVDVAVKLHLGEDAGDFQCSHNASACDVHGSEHGNATKESLSDGISADMKRLREKSSFKVVGGTTAYNLSIPPKDERGENFARDNTEALMKALNRLIGGGDEIGKPVPNQLKTMCLMCWQSGSAFFGDCFPSQANDLPVDKSFALQKDGSVLYSASAEVEGATHTIQYQIEKDGTSHLVDYSKSKG